MCIDLVSYPILDLIETPRELRMLSTNNLPLLCNELRDFLLHCVSFSGGHFASGLGVIELTVALHYCYQTPFDNLIWDVGHQAYPHKILTGRRKRISTIRQKNGLHAFPHRIESEYDVFGVGHSSTSISAGLGMAVAAEYENNNRKTVCIIGDGAITAGISFEAINHAGDIGKNILIVLNDNQLSISKNVGALNNHLKKIVLKTKKKLFNKNWKNIFLKIPFLGVFLEKFNDQFKNKISCETMFEKLGLNYIGPIDGHNVLKLVEILKKIQVLDGPQLLHVVTKKGKGYAPAEMDPISWHAVPKFDLKTYSFPAFNKKLNFSDIFGDWLCEEASKDSKLIAITPAMREGSGMVKFSRKYPKQYFDVAIAEQHAITFAAGLAVGGFSPVVAIYSTFLQRAYDQLIHDVSIQNLPVLFAVDRSGIVGADGETHQGSFDLSFLRCLPGMIIMSPSNENELRQMLHTGYHYKNGPVVVRYPKKIIFGVELFPLTKIQIGSGVVHRKGERIAILNFGTLLYEAIKAANFFNATVIDMRFVKPLDELLLLKIIKTHNLLVTLEENSIIGGAGSGVNEFLFKNRSIIPTINLGFPDFYISHGDQREIYEDLGLDAEGIKKSINNYLYR